MGRLVVLLAAPFALVIAAVWVAVVRCAVAEWVVVLAARSRPAGPSRNDFIEEQIDWIRALSAQERPAHAATVLWEAIRHLAGRPSTKVPSVRSAAIISTIGLTHSAGVLGGVVPVASTVGGRTGAVVLVGLHTLCLVLISVAQGLLWWIRRHHPERLKSIDLS